MSLPCFVKIVTTFLQNKYNKEDVRHVLIPPKDRMTPLAEDEELEHMANIPFCSTVWGRIGRMLKKHQFRFSNPLGKMDNYWAQLKDALGLKVPRVYYITCKCGLYKAIKTYNFRKR